VVRLVMKEGEYLPPHSVPGEITVHCVSGALGLGVEDDKRTLRAGEMCYLHGGARHDVTAIRDCVALVTIALVSNSALPPRRQQSAAPTLAYRDGFGAATSGASGRKGSMPSCSQPGPNSSMGCWVRSVPLPQIMESAAQ
jgi:hypothetical protein